MRIIWKAVLYMTLSGFGYGALCGALFGVSFGLIGGFPVAIFLGFVMGFLLGGITGLIAGSITGLVLGWIITLSVNKVLYAVYFQRTVVIICATIGFLITAIGLMRLFGKGEFRLDLMAFFFVPALIAAAASACAGWGFAQRYVEEQGQFQMARW